jgi:hypothetical protein
VHAVPEPAPRPIMTAQLDGSHPMTRLGQTLGEVSPAPRPMPSTVNKQNVDHPTLTFLLERNNQHRQRVVQGRLRRHFFLGHAR